MPCVCRVPSFRPLAALGDGTAGRLRSASLGAGVRRLTGHRGRARPLPPRAVSADRHPGRCSYHGSAAPHALRRGHALPPAFAVLCGFSRSRASQSAQALARCGVGGASIWFSARRGVAVRRPAAGKVFGSVGGVGSWLLCVRGCRPRLASALPGLGSFLPRGSVVAPVALRLVQRRGRRLRLGGGGRGSRPRAAASHTPAQGDLPRSSRAQGRAAEDCRLSCACVGRILRPAMSEFGGRTRQGRKARV